MEVPVDFRGFRMKFSKGFREEFQDISGRFQEGFTEVSSGASREISEVFQWSFMVVSGGVIVAVFTRFEEGFKMVLQ